MTNLERAIKDGYAHIIGEKGKEKITYVSSDNHVENYSDPEEKVRAEFWAELIYKYEYPVNRIKIEVTVPDRLPTDRADIVVFRDDECKRPYAVVECKKDCVTDAEFNQAIEQGVGNATWVKLRADYVVIIAGCTRRVLDVTDKFGALEREQNILADLPHAYGKPQEFRFYKGSENDIKPVDREDLIAAIKKCHQTLWGGGRLSPPTAFGELCKLIFVKISDEQKPRKKGEPYVPISRLQEKDYCKKGEVLFNNTNSAEWVGKSTVFDIDTPCATSNHITRITLKEGINPYYIAAFFNMLRSIGYWKLLSTYFNNQAGVNTETLKAVRILLPKKTIQDEIAEEILRRKNTAEALRIEAEQDWEAAKAEFERKLLGE